MPIPGTATNAIDIGKLPVPNVEYPAQQWLSRSPNQYTSQLSKQVQANGFTGVSTIDKLLRVISEMDPPEDISQYFTNLGGLLDTGMIINTHG
jgi:hypothetical protein